MGGASAPTPFDPLAAIWAKSAGPEGPSARDAVFAVSRAVRILVRAQ
ncbi:DUF6053 domain-containing protein [Lysobacter enzymogenes]